MQPRARCSAYLLLLTLFIYVHSLGGSFVWDDEYMYLENRLILKQTLRSAFTTHLFAFMPNEQGQQYYRPLATLAHSWLARATGMQPFAMHLASVLAFAAAGILVFLIAAELVELRVAFAAGALFIVHPLHVEAVAWMSALSEVLAGTLLLLSLFALLRARWGSPGWWAVSLSAAAAAYLMKETTLVLPLLAAVFVGWRAWPFALLAAGYVGLRYAVLGMAAVQVRQRPPLRHLTIAANAALEYAKKLIWPWPLAPEFQIAHSTLAWVLFIAACAAAILLAWRMRASRPAFALLVIPLLIPLSASIAFPALRLAQDRYTYVAIAGLALLLAYAARHKAGVAALVAVAIVWSALSIAAIRHWRDPEALWSHTLRITPASKTAALGLGYWYYSTERFAEAESVYEQALRYHPNDPQLLESRAAIRKRLR